MSHFTVVVFSKDGTEADVERLLAPYDEQDEWGREGSYWDWWVIGGRWEGQLTGRDPVTIEVPCNLCNGTGARDWTGCDVTPEWIAECNGCNGCRGTGTRTEYPNQYNNDVFGNSCPPAAIRPDFVPYAFVTPDGEWIGNGEMGWWGIEREEGQDSEEQWRTKFAEAKGAFAGTTAVLVDCHV